MGIIKGFQIELNYELLWYNIETVIGIDATGHIENIINEYSHNIVAAHKTTGEYDTMLITRFKDTIELNHFLEILRKEDNVNKTYTQQILNNINN